MRLPNLSIKYQVLGFRYKKKLLNTKYIIRNTGFTLIELLIVISIIGIMSTIGVVMYSSVQSSARDAKRKSDIEDIKKALYLYKNTNNTFCLYPPGGGLNCPWTASMSDPSLGANGTSTSSIKNRLVPTYMKLIPTDPKNNSVEPYLDYYVNIPNDNSFVISAKLEGTVPSPLPCTFQPGYNYCVSE